VLFLFDFAHYSLAMKSRLVNLKFKNKTAWIYPEQGLQLYGYEENLNGTVATVVDFPLNCEEPADRRYGNPILFPAPSKTFSKQGPDLWEWNGKVYRMPFHGFARNLYWRITQLTENKIQAELAKTANTTVSFPFEFKFSASYTLDDRGLVLDVLVQNLGAEPFPYGVGFHPYIKAPLGKSGTPADCTVDSPQAVRAKTTDEWKSHGLEPFAARQFRASEDLVESFVLTQTGLKFMELHDHANKLIARVSVEQSKKDFPVWVVWNASPTAGYVCLEPWTDVPNALSRSETRTCPPGETHAYQIAFSVKPM
jgi:galactose mutarotase-like enzyme